MVATVTFSEFGEPIEFDIPSRDEVLPVTDLPAQGI